MDFDFSNIKPSDITAPGSKVEMDYQYGDGTKHFIVSSWMDLPDDLLKSIGETWPELIVIDFNQAPAQIQNMVTMVLQHPHLIPEFIKMLGEAKVINDKKGFNAPTGVGGLVPSITTTLNKDKLDSMSAYNMAQTIVHNFNQEWMKQCDKKAAEYDNKGEDGLAAWWKVVMDPMACVEKDKHHKFLKSFLQEQLDKAGGELKVTNKKKALQADDGVSLPKFIDNPLSNDTEEVTAFAQNVINFCKPGVAYKHYMDIWNAHAGDGNLIPNTQSTLNYTLEDIESLKHIHKDCAIAVRNLLAGENVLLKGPTGSGKSFLAKQIRLILQVLVQYQLTFYDMVVGPNFTEFDYLAKTMPMADEEDGAGKLAVIRSPFMTGFILGYCLVFVDEIAAAQAEVNIALNGALANRRQFDPSTGETRECGHHFYFLAADNTDLTGPTPDYPTRVQQDDSFISRFVGSRIHVDYDLALEKKLFHPRVFKLFQKFRKLIANKKVKVELSTRLGVKLTNKINSNMFTYDEAVSRWLSELSLPVKEALGIDKDDEEVEVVEED